MAAVEEKQRVMAFPRQDSLQKTSQPRPLTSQLREGEPARRERERERNSPSCLRFIFGCSRPLLPPPPRSHPTEEKVELCSGSWTTGRASLCSCTRSTEPASRSKPGSDLFSCPLPSPKTFISKERKKRARLAPSRHTEHDVLTSREVTKNDCSDKASCTASQGAPSVPCTQTTTTPWCHLK